MTTEPVDALDMIYLGDCMDLLRRLPDGAVDLVVSSPPYNIGKEYEARVALDDYLEEQRAVLKECHRVLSDRGSIFWQVGAYSNKGALYPLDIKFFPILEDMGMIPRNRIVWARTHGLHARKKFSARHETILWFTKTDDYTFDLDAVRVPQKYQNKKAWRGDNKGELTCHPDGKNPGDIWFFRNVKHNHEEQTEHPAQFPEDLVARVVLAASRPGDVVLDPYMGAGTVAVVARDTGRRYLGAELDSEYHRLAMRRLSGEPDERGLFPNLKTLRDYAERTGSSAARFRFDRQRGAKASDRSKSRIYSEDHHAEQIAERLIYEEQSWASQLRGDDPPSGHSSGSVPSDQPSLLPES